MKAGITAINHKPKGRGYPWTEEEVQILRSNAGKMSSSDIAKMIDRSKHAVQIKAIRLGISLDGYCKKMICMDCGTPTFVPWQANGNIRCPICQEKFKNQGKKIYDHFTRPDRFNQKAYGGNRYKALERDGFKCRLCGSTTRLVLHHINEQSYHNSETPNNDLDNLTTLCNSCHVQYHALRNRNGKKQRGII